MQRLSQQRSTCCQVCNEIQKSKGRQLQSQRACPRRGRRQNGAGAHARQTSRETQWRTSDTLPAPGRGAHRRARTCAVKMQRSEVDPSRVLQGAQAGARGSAVATEGGRPAVGPGPWRPLRVTGAVGAARVGHVGDGHSGHGEKLPWRLPWKVWEDLARQVWGVGWSGSWKSESWREWERDEFEIWRGRCRCEGEP